jgi:hypothetical protein
MRRLTYAEATALRNRLRDGMNRFLPKWRQLAQYISPERLKENPDDKHNGYRKDRSIIKNQAGRSLRTFVSGMMNGATPRSRPWFNLTVNNKGKAASATAKKFFAESEAILNSHFQVSNLYRILPMAYKDVGVFSNAAFAMLPDPRFGFYFYPFAIGTYAFSCDSQGNTNTFTRDFSLTVRQVVENYAGLKPDGKIDWKGIPNWIKEHWDAAKYQETAVLAQLIVPNPQYDPAKQSLDPADKKFQSYTWVHAAGNNLPPQSSSGFRNERVEVDGQEFLKVSGFDYFPVITPRWEVMPEEDYGIDGPGEIALGDIMTLQEMEKWRLEAVAKMVKPPMVGHASLRRHQASILAGGITYVDEQGAQAGFKPAFMIDPKLGDLIQDQQEYTQAIRSAFYEDLFLMLSGDKTVSHVTAREIDEKAAERMSTLAPVLGQWDQDLSSPLIRNAQIILEQAGKLPKRPQELMGEQLRPEYISILAQAAKVSMMNSVERAVQFTATMAQVTQDASLIKLLDGEKVARAYYDYVAIDPTLIRDDQEFGEIKEIAAQEQQAMKQQAMMAQESESAKNLSQAKVGEGSMLDTLLQAAQP